MLRLNKEQYTNLQTQLLELPAKYSLTILQYLHGLVQNQQEELPQKIKTTVGTSYGVTNEKASINTLTPS